MKIVVTGYASLDYAVRLDSPRAAPTAPRRSCRARANGRASAARRPMSRPRSPRAGVGDATPVSWVGDDAEGRRYRDALARLGLRDGGRRGRGPGRTPVCILAYQPDGGCLASTIPVLPIRIELDATQRALIAAADALCVTVGPAEATREALALARPDATVVWVVKADPRAVPPDLAAALAARADVIVHSRGEAPFVAAASERASADYALRRAGRRAWRSTPATSSRSRLSSRSRRRTRRARATPVSAAFSRPGLGAARASPRRRGRARRACARCSPRESEGASHDAKRLVHRLPSGRGRRGRDPGRRPRAHRPHRRTSRGAAFPRRRTGACAPSPACAAASASRRRPSAWAGRSRPSCCTNCSTLACIVSCASARRWRCLRPGSAISSSPRAPRAATAPR